MADSDGSLYENAALESRGN